MKPTAIATVAVAALVGGVLAIGVIAGATGGTPIPAASAAQCPPTPNGPGPAPTVPNPTSTPPPVQALRAGHPALYTPGDVNGPAASADGGAMPYSLPATRGKTGLEETVDATGAVPSTGGRVTWAQFAALGAAYRDYYITMRWNYAAWNFDGTSTDIDQAQFAWFAAKPRLVLVTNPRTGASIIAAAIEAGPAPWVGVTTSPTNTPAAGWANPTRGTPAGYDGIVSGFPPTAIAALGARTGYPGQDGDDLTYQWAPDQNAIPGPTTATAEQAGYTIASQPATCPAVPGAQTEPVDYAGPTVTIPSNPQVVWHGKNYAGTVIHAPTAAVARTIAAGLQYLGIPYVWGGGGPAGPDHGCARATCLPQIGFDCSGLTSYMMAVGGWSVPANSYAQRDRVRAVSWSQAEPGDIIGYPGHVAIYLGTIDGQRLQLEAPDTGDYVRVTAIYRSDVDDVVYRWWASARL